VAAVRAAGRGVAVGCAPGADLLVRSAAGPAASVFSVAALGLSSAGCGGFAARSVALVRAVAASGPGAGLVVFVSRPCPSGLLPCSAPFSGLGSGSWASAALAAWLGLPVVVFWCGGSLPFSAAAALPLSWGCWSPVASGPFAGGWLLSVSARRGARAAALAAAAVPLPGLGA
jgi:hypothetical protein